MALSQRSKDCLKVTLTDPVAFTEINNTLDDANTQLADVTAGTAAAGKVLVLGSSGEIATITSATVTNLTATTITQGALVAAGGTLAMSAATHAGRTIALDTAAGSVVTLPASTASGNVYRFLVTVTATSNSHVIKVANASDEMRGYVIQDSDTATAPNIWWAADNDDTITLNRTSTGLAAQGEYFEIVDAVLNHYFVRGYSQASGTEATPFSATV